MFVRVQGPDAGKRQEVRSGKVQTPNMELTLDYDARTKLVRLTNSSSKSAEAVEATSSSGSNKQSQDAASTQLPPCKLYSLVGTTTC